MSTLMKYKPFDLTYFLQNVITFTDRVDDRYLFFGGCFTMAKPVRDQAYSEVRIINIYTGHAPTDLTPRKATENHQKDVMWNPHPVRNFGEERILSAVAVMTPQFVDCPTGVRRAANPLRFMCGLP
jgi:hypothetical protein